jgi:hypothetical protein
MTDLINTEQACKEFMDIFMTELRNQLASLGKAVSGNLINSLSYTISRTNNGFDCILNAADYLSVVDEGRRPGSFPPLDKIEIWAEAKGIKIGTPRQTAFVIGRSISEKGIQPTDVINKSFDAAFERYKGKFLDQIELDFNDMIDKINLKINNK